MSALAIEQRLRRWLFLLAGGIFLGTPFELWLHDHTDETQQKIPFILCGLGILVIFLGLVRPQRATLLTLQGVMVVIILGSLLGMYFHLKGNFDFEQEIRPNASQSELLKKAIKGGSPLLAPGVLAIAGSISLIAAHLHPSTRGETP